MLSVPPFGTDKMKRIALDITDSTNRYAKALPSNESKELTLVTAEFQEAGRGAGTNKWESEQGKNLLFSLIAYPQRLQANQMFALSEVTALAIRDALSSYTPGFQIKWPNDIYYNDKKISGMLIENDLRGKWVHRSIIGVGVDINQTSFLSDAPNPVSLAQILGKAVERNQVLNSILLQFNHYYGMMEREQFSELHKRYMQHLYRRNALHPYTDATGTFQARIIDVEPTGHLVLECQNGEQRRYDFKEVSFLIQS
ncbi:MAG: biotin--[Bacteroidaceae bacterium]|nr:biotin--[acetyl-CoA-carboxylase] ligase [Bacteroidaceae bacterium]